MCITCFKLQFLFCLSSLYNFFFFFFLVNVPSYHFPNFFRIYFRLEPFTSVFFLKKKKKFLFLFTLYPTYVLILCLLHIVYFILFFNLLCFLSFFFFLHFMYFFVVV
ncbi:hypothetical protein HMI56_000002 [Coelomomyces lativittatus]|nr:hypothetical protein HMI56_000002 [Coelomomyces lativittatus]